MKLIDNAGKWYRMFSQQALVIIGSIQVMLAGFPEPWLAAQVPFIGIDYRSLGMALTGTVAVMGFIGRLIKQSSVSEPTP